MTKTNARQDAIPVPADFCTLTWAAEHLELSLRSVQRLVRDGKLSVFRPLVGSQESGRRHNMLMTEQVRNYRAARDLLRAGQ